jgi:hypothetical protein
VRFVVILAACACGLGPGNHLATLPGTISSLACDRQGLVVAAGPLYRVPYHGGVELFDPAAPRPHSGIFGLGGGSVYVSDVLAVTVVTRGLPDRVLVHGHFQGAILVDESRTYWMGTTDADAVTRLRSAPHGGGEDLDGPEVTDQRWLVAQDADSLFLEDLQRIYRYSKSDFAQVVQSWPAQNALGVASNGSRIVWSDSHQIWESDFSGTVPHPIANWPDMLSLWFHDSALLGYSGHRSGDAESGNLLLTSTIVLIGGGTEQLARLETSTYWIPYTECAAGVFWARGADLYRAH